MMRRATFAALFGLTLLAGLGGGWLASAHREDPGMRARRDCEAVVREVRDARLDAADRAKLVDRCILDRGARG